jgi:hypothetical protein
MEALRAASQDVTVGSFAAGDKRHRSLRLSFAISDDELEYYGNVATGL